MSAMKQSFPCSKNLRNSTTASSNNPRLINKARNVSNSLSNCWNPKISLCPCIRHTSALTLTYLPTKCLSSCTMMMIQTKCLGLQMERIILSTVVKKVMTSMWTTLTTIAIWPSSIHRIARVSSHRKQHSTVQELQERTQKPTYKTWSSSSGNSWRRRKSC